MPRRALRSPATPPGTRSSARSSQGALPTSWRRPHPAVDRDAVAHALVDHVRRGRHQAVACVEHPARPRGGPAIAAQRFDEHGRGSELPHHLRHAAVVVASAHDEHERDRRQRQRRRAQRDPGRPPRPAGAVVDQAADHGPGGSVPAAARLLGRMRHDSDLDVADPQLLAAREHRLLDPLAVDEGAVGRAEVAHAQAAGGLRPQLRVVARRPLVTDDEVAAAHATENERPALLRRDLDRPPGVGAGHDPQPHGPGLISRRRRRPGACGASPAVAGGRTGWRGSRRRSRARPRGCGPACRARPAAPWTRG